MIIGGDFNCVLDTSLDRSSTRVIQPSKSAVVIKDFCEQYGLLDPWRFFFPFSKEFSFFSPVHHSYSRIDFFLVDKSLMSFISTSKYHSIVISDHAPSLFKLSFPNYHSCFRPWRLNSLLLSDDEFVKFLSKEIAFFLETNDTPDISRATLWEALKALKWENYFLFLLYQKAGDLKT